MLLALCSTCFAWTIGEAKRDFPDQSPVSLQNACVTAVFPGCVYVEEPTRSAGIRVATSEILSEGDVVYVEGILQTDSTSDERYIEAYAGYPKPTGETNTLKPLGLNRSAFVGADSGFQKGLSTNGGLNTIGLLVTIWGPVSQFDATESRAWFKIGDQREPDIKVEMPSGQQFDTDQGFVTVTGICSVEKVDNQMTRVLKVRKADDIINHQSWAEERLKSMTIDEKIGQLFQIRISGDVVTDDIKETITSKHLGGIIYFQYNGNLDDPVRSATMSNELQECAMGTDGKGIPLFLSMDQEGGLVTRITGGAQGPGNMGIGASRSTSLAQLTGRTFGSEIRAVGANMDLAPVLDVNDNPANPVIGVRSFGEKPDIVSPLGQAYIKGLHNMGVIATGKHFPGHGDTNTDSHTGLPIVTYDFNTLDTIHARPFREAIANGLDSIMTAHIVVTCLDPDHPATLSPQVITGYLRGNLGFDGVVMTDSMGMAGITSGYGNAQAAVLAIQAGVDLMSLPPDLDTAWNAIKTAVTNGDISEDRINQSVARLLKLKHKYGLFENPYVDANAAGSIVGCDEHKAADLNVARGAITLVQNNDNVLPLHLTSAQKILLVTVQSSETSTDAATRFASFITAKHSNTQSMSISASPSSSTRSTVKTAAASADVIIVGTSRSQLYSGQTSLITALCTLGKPVICVGLREPYELASWTQVNAYLCAYSCHNCALQAATDVIFGDHSPYGKLPVSIPGVYDCGWGLSF